MKNVTPKLLPTSVTLRSVRPEGGVRWGEMIPRAERGDQLTGARPGIACIATAAGEPSQGLHPSPATARDLKCPAADQDVRAPTVDRTAARDAAAGHDFCATAVHRSAGRKSALDFAKAIRAF